MNLIRLYSVSVVTICGVETSQLETLCVCVCVCVRVHVCVRVCVCACPNYYIVYLALFVDHPSCV